MKKGTTIAMALNAFKKPFLIMKLTLLLMVVCTVQAIAGSGANAQTITLKAENKEISKVLSAIQRQSDFRFIFNSRLSDLTQKVSVEFKQTDITGVMKQLFSGTSLTYIVLENNLIAIRSEKPEEADIEVSGRVVNEAGEAVPASIQVKGSSVGTSTDANGNFSITVPENAVLVVTAVGYASTEVSVNGRRQITINLKNEERKMDEVVVIGYGTAKKGDLTSAISTIKPEDLKKTPNGNLLNAVQGNVTGVQINSIGGPGDVPEINIRGIKSLYGGGILYVVDGVFVDNIDFLSSNDIQDFQILKDASSAAIYGYKASNGVILITTKGGRYNRPANVSYSGYYGVQSATNVVKMANAEQFVNFANESGSSVEIASVQAAIARFGRSRVNPNLPNVNTDWYKQALRNAPIMNHDISVDGGSDKVTYSVGGSLFTQDGILDMDNSYKRYNLRAKLEAKAKSWLTVGASLVYSKSEQYTYGNINPWAEIYYAVPILPVLDSNFAAQAQNSKPYSDARDIGYRGSQNPFPGIENVNNLGERRRITANVFGDFHIIPKTLNFRTSLSYNNKNDNNRLVNLPYFIDNDYQRTLVQSSITRSNALEENYTFDNTLTYNKLFGDHDVTAMGGFSFRDERFNFFSTTGNFYEGSPFSRAVEQSWYINNTAVASRVSSDGGSRVYSRSFFGRLQYKYKDKYIAYGTLRNEAANKYDQERSITLPSVGLAWIVSSEEFMKKVKAINYLKLRAGWGRLANGNVPTARAQSANAVWSVFNDTKVDGFNFSTYQDNLGWEFNEEINVGADVDLFGRRLNLTVDYFVKNTKNLAIPVLPQVGNETSYNNVGTMRNKGIEIAATWRGTFAKDWGYTIGGNFSTIKNEVTDLFGQAFLTRGPLAEFPQRLTVGQPFDVFYGWDIVGVYQNQAEVDADPVAVAANTAGAGTVKPGYFKYRDVDGNKVLDANDRIYLGSPAPTYYYGANLGLNYKNIDLSVRIYGQGGNIIFNSNRAEVFRNQGRNIDAQLAKNRWNGEGTSSSYPSSEGYRTAWNQRASRFWLEDGKFFRIQNIQLGYSLEKFKKLPDMRFTLTADRPYVWSKSKSTNVEVGFDGIDSGTYPIPSVFTLGWSVKL
ncbi:MAG: SusC/RagA family TonB-linked outer membrane protein [Chitinophagaceae bacterium]|nr:MAG: SusC/RagA family TonB-linked outer membrane protein [Chitinophagaceae bacterium]